MIRPRNADGFLTPSRRGIAARRLWAQAHQKPAAAAVCSPATGLAPGGRSRGAGGTERFTSGTVRAWGWNSPARLDVSVLKGRIFSLPRHPSPVLMKTFFARQEDQQHSPNLISPRYYQAEQNSCLPGMQDNTYTVFGFQFSVKIRR
jgi:hypothetical protein